VKRRPLRIGTRGSQLALWQARAVATRLETDGVAAELVLIKTSGDRLQSAPMSEVGGKRLFVKEIEDALLAEEVDLAVHSAKDMSAVLPAGLAIAATLPREDPRDAIVLPPGSREDDVDAVLSRLGRGSRIGTSSIRRIAQLAVRIPSAMFVPIRGNVDTRLRKLDAGEYDALVVAAAGLRRLGFGERISAALPPRDCVPAPGQGIVAIEIRADDRETRRFLEPVHDAAAAAALDAERAVVAALGGGCQLPLGALATVNGGEMELHAAVCSPDGSRVIHARSQGPAAAAVSLGEHAARQLTDQGAMDILDALRGSSGASSNAGSQTASNG
jgi:hydroxymethylbilane synthase